MNERTIQIDVIGKIEGTQFMKCKLYTKRWQKSRFSRGVEYNQYFHRKKLILKTKKNDYG